MPDREPMTHAPEPAPIPGVRFIPLRNRRGWIVDYALVSEVDFDRVNAYRWGRDLRGHTRGGAVYVKRANYIDGKYCKTRLHVFILGERKGLVIDHKDGNGLNNTRENLRYATREENARNVRRKTGRVDFIGVQKQAKARTWQISIRVSGSCLRRAGFACPTLAALRRDALAVTHHGEFAVLNFPEVFAGD